MLRKFYSLFIILLISPAALLFAQTGTIKGRISDLGSKETIPGAAVIAELNGVTKLAAPTDLDGNYTLKPLDPGKYTIRVKFIGYHEGARTNVVVNADKITFLDIPIILESVKIKGVDIQDYKNPLIDKDNTTQQTVIDRDQIAKAPTRNIFALAATGAGVYQGDVGRGISIKGARGDANVMYIDGIKVIGTSGISNASIEQISVITGGTPAQYGDVTGGVISIITRGPASQYTGGVELETSELLDKFGHNFLGINFSGPLLLKRDTVKKVNRSVLGFFLAGELHYQKDPFPSAVGAWKVKDDKLAELEENPLRPASLGTGSERNAEHITESDLEKLDARSNVPLTGYRFNGKIDFKPSLSSNLTFGGTYDYQNLNNFEISNMLFNYKNNSQSIDKTYRVFGRFTQRFGSEEETKEKSGSNIKNAFYSIQLDYTKYYGVDQSEDHKDNIFNYGHIGKFTTYKTPTYAYKTDTINGQPITAYYLSGFQDTLFLFDGSSSSNPLTANYTEQFYELAGDNVIGNYQNYSQVQFGGGLLNGDQPQSIYSLWRNTGTQSSGYAKVDNSQFTLSTSGSADIKDHAIKIGIEYEQRIERAYSIGPTGLWTLMRQLSNSHIAQLDLANPQMVYDVNGVFQDTVNYDRLYDAESQAYFDVKLREKLGLAVNGTDWIDIDSYAPETYSTDMFSADELLNDGNSYVAYYGYDHTGKKLSSKPSFDDFFTKKDANGNYTREIGAFEPNYMAGYIQDNFAFRDLIFNIGVRVDRFDANQKVLKDKYLLYEAKTAAEVSNFGSHPSNIGDDYVVYVNDLSSPTAIVGYRSEDKWYDAAGGEVNDPSILAKNTSTGQITPYLIDPSNAEISSKVFKDYEPQLNVMPRIAFSFPISDEALFFAHYDVLTRRPISGSRIIPTHYLFIESYAVGNVINNPDLKPERTTEYELGFKQKISRTSALSISAFYREIKDWIQIININYAYPVSYQTYDNIDFGTTKGINVGYDLRRTGNIYLTANYSLQFADGTGSSATSGFNLASAGLPNLRTPFPLSYDQRHTIVLSADYRFESGTAYNGPKWFGKDIFANAGANVKITAGSGTPYSAQANFTPEAAFGIPTTAQLSGSIHGSRLPWNKRIDVRIDKTIFLKWGGVGEDKKLASLNIYLRATNILNTMNVLAVYGATGNPDDDGYLASPDGQSNIQAQINPEAYVDQYTIKINNPFNYSLPRMMSLGVILNF